MTITLEITVTAQEKENQAKNANCDFEGVILILDHQGGEAKINYSAKKQKGHLSALKFEKNAALGTMPISLHNEMAKLILESINDFQEKNKSEEIQYEGESMNIFFQIPNNQWTKFIEPKRGSDYIIPPQRNSNFNFLPKEELIE